MEGPSTAITAVSRGRYSSTSARIPRKFPSPSSPTSPASTIVFAVRTPDTERPRARPTIAARPAPLSEMPGAVRRLPSRFTRTSVPWGKTVSRCAASRIAAAPGSDPGRSAITFPVESTRTLNPSVAKRLFRASPRAASPNSGAGISFRRICCSVTQAEFFSIHSRARAQAGLSAILAMAASVARAESVAIKIKIPQIRARFTRFVRDLAPIVENIHARAVVARQSAARFHGYSLRLDAESARDQGLKSLAARNVHARGDLFRAGPTRAGLDGLQQPVEIQAAARAWAHRCQFHVANTRGGFRPRANVTDGQGSKLRAVPQENRVAEVLVGDRANLELHVEPIENFIGDFAACCEQFGALFRLCHREKRCIRRKRGPGLRLGRRLGYGFFAHVLFGHVVFDYVLGHESHKVARPETKLLVERHMLRGIRKGIEAQMAISPAPKDFHRRHEKLLRDAAIPV